ncbi:MAG: hypothetical protein U0792_11490 [Gemmataceae bacterium]
MSDAVPMSADGFNKMQVEACGTIVENEFRSPKVALFHVLGRREHRVLLEHPPLPHAGPTTTRDAVFLAEMLNYFEYRYPGPPVTTRCHSPSISPPVPGSPSTNSPASASRPAPSQVTNCPAEETSIFLIDVSGSMGADNRHATTR